MLKENYNTREMFLKAVSGSVLISTSSVLCVGSTCCCNHRLQHVVMSILHNSTVINVDCNIRHPENVHSSSTFGTLILLKICSNSSENTQNPRFCFNGGYLVANPFFQA